MAGGRPVGYLQSVIEDLNSELPKKQTPLVAGWRPPDYNTSALNLHSVTLPPQEAHEPVSEQNVRDFPQTKLDCEINAPFLFNEHGDPPLFIS